MGRVLSKLCGRADHTDKETLPGEVENGASSTAKTQVEVTSDTGTPIDEPKESGNLPVPHTVIATNSRDIRGDFSGNTGSHNIFGSYSGNVNSTITATAVSHHYNSGVVHYHLPPVPVKTVDPNTFWMVTYSWNEGFTGRAVIIQELKDLSAKRSHNRIALFGFGGAGKTQIALEYSYSCQGHRPVFWVHGSSSLKFSEDFKGIAQYADVILNEGDSDDKQLLAVKKWLEGPDCGDWLLIVDNADNETDFANNSSAIARFLPQGPKGMMVVTTRSRQIANRLGCKAIKVNKMPAEEAKSLFFQRCDVPNIEEEGDAIMEILELLDYVPLGIVGAAAYMTETQTLAHEYLAIFKKRDQSSKDLLSQGFNDIYREGKEDMTESILSAYFITFERLMQQMPMAAQVLFLTAFLDRQNIPEELLLNSGLEGVGDPVQYRNAIGKLLGFSLVTKITNVASEKPAYELHCLVQLSIQAYLAREEVVTWRGRALNVVARLFPEFEHRVRDVCRVYLPHAVAVLEGSEGSLVDHLSYRISHYLCQVGSYASAEMYIRQCIALREESGELDPRYWERIELLATILRRTGRYEEAEVFSRRALQGRERALGPDHLDTLSSFANLAAALSRLGKYDAAAAMNRRALEGREKILGPEHAAVLSSMDNLVVVLDHLGRYEEAELMSRRAIAGQEKMLGLDHTDTLAGYLNLATVLRHQEKYGEAEGMSRRSAEGRETILGPEHPDTLAAMSNLALVLGAQRKYSDAEEMHRRILSAREKVLGPAHAQTLRSLSNLGEALVLQGRFEEAEEFSRRALKGREESLGVSHPHTLTSAMNLANILSARGNHSEAEGLYRRTLEGREKALGDEHPDTLAAMHNLAETLFGRGDYREAGELVHRAIEGRKKVLGFEHGDTYLALLLQAGVHASAGQVAEAEEEYRKVCEGAEKRLGVEHPVAVRCRKEYGAFRNGVGRMGDKSYTIAMSGSSVGGV